MSRYKDLVSGVSPTGAAARRAADIVAALAPPAKSTTVAADGTTALTPVAAPAPHESAKDIAISAAPGLAGAAAGAFFWKSHRVLGALLGHAVAANALPLYRGEHGERTRAMTQLGIESAGVVGSLLSKRHRILGWAAGLIVGGVAASFVPGNIVKYEYAKFKAKK